MTGTSFSVSAHAAPMPGTLGPPRMRLRNVVLALCVLAVPLTLMKSWQLVWQPLVPLALLFLRAHTIARLQTIAVLLLLVLGGAVTTYRVGMAVPDWPSTFRDNMWTYPLDEMLARGYGVTLEHTHRLWASAVGLVAICQVLAAHIHRERRSVVVLAWATLFAISFQGLLGGTRVLEDSQHLAFLHGALAQAVFGLIVASWIVSSERWRTSPRHPSVDARPLRASALKAAVLVYVQIVLGAATRHSGHHAPLGLHLTLAIVVLVVVTILIGRLGGAHARAVEAGQDVGVLRGLKKVTAIALHTQILLGVLVTVAIFLWSKGFDMEVSVGEGITASLHVAGGAVLLAATIAATLWSWRLLRPLDSTPGTSA
jgi:cytochrome c oxidase assembly protein subunit 15